MKMRKRGTEIQMAILPGLCDSLQILRKAYKQRFLAIDDIKGVLYSPIKTSIILRIIFLYIKAKRMNSNHLRPEAY